MGKPLNLEGKRFGKLVVNYRCNYRDDKNRILWNCTCDCGNNVDVVGHYLTCGGKDNCGCMTLIKNRESNKKYNKYNLDGEYGIGYTNKGEEFYFDLEDYDKIKDYCWFIHKGYVETNTEDNKTISMHRLVMETYDNNFKVDHIYHKTNDNRKSQLRICSNQENCMNHNLAKNNTSGKSGVSYRKDTGKWRVRIWYNGECYSLGCYDDYDEAVKVRNEKEKELFGEYRNDDEK